MGNDIETNRVTGSDYWAALEQKSKQMAIDDRPKPMSKLSLCVLPVVSDVYVEIYCEKNTH